MLRGRGNDTSALATGGDELIPLSQFSEDLPTVAFP